MVVDAEAWLSGKMTSLVVDAEAWLICVHTFAKVVG